MGWGKLKFISNPGQKLADISKGSSDYDTALGLLKIGSWEWDLINNSISCSPFLSNLLNSSLDGELDISLVLNQISPNDQSRVKAELINHFKNHAPFLIKFKFISRGEVYSLEMSGCPSVDEKGQLVKVVGLVRDNSYRDVVIDSLEKSENELRQAEKRAHLGSWRWSLRNKKFTLSDELWHILEDSDQGNTLTYFKVKSLFNPSEWKQLVQEVLSKNLGKHSGFIKNIQVHVNGVCKYLNISFDCEFVDQLLVGVHGTVQDVSENKLMEDQLKYRLEFERMISAISSNFINLKNDKVNVGVNIALDILGTFLDIDRLFLCLFNQEQTSARFNFAWARAGFEYPKNIEYKEFNVSGHYGLQEALKGETICLSDLSGFDEMIRDEKHSWFDRKVKSVLCVPLYIEGVVKGVLGLQCLEQKKDWHPDEVGLIRMVGEVFINTLRRKEFEALQTNNEQFLSTIINSLSDGVFAINENGLITKMNTRAEELSGVSKKNALGKNIKDVLKFFNTDESSYELAKEVSETGASFFQSELSMIVSKNQQMVPVQVSGTPLRQYGVELNGCVMLCRDMSHQVKLEEQLKQSEKMRLVGQLSGGIAHDFNNLLTGILGCANFLKKKHVGEDDSLKYIDNILTASRRATTLTSQLLTFSRREKPKLTGLDCHDIINDVLQLIEATFDPSIQIKSELKAQKSHLLGDVTQLHNAILNICVNAKDAMPNGGELLFTSSDENVDEKKAEEFKVASGLFLKIMIQDSGTGISESVLSNIFEPFFTTKDKNKGTGLGLAAVYGTVISHKGAIRVWSEVGEGTAFSIYLPIFDTVIEKNTALLKGPLMLNDKTILVVDDEELNCLVARETLEDAGCQVFVEQNGLKAIELYREHFRTIDLVILDMLMPKIKGPDLLRELVKINPDVKAIIASGYSGNLGEDEILKTRKVPFLQKPYEEEDFLSMISSELVE